MNPGVQGGNSIPAAASPATGDKWILAITNNRAICYEAQNIFSFCGCNGNFPFERAELLDPEDFVIARGSDCSVWGYTETPISYPKHTRELGVDRNCHATGFQTSPRKMWFRYRQNWQDFLDGSKTHAECREALASSGYFSHAILTNPGPFSGASDMSTFADMLVKGGYENVYCGGSVPCGPAPGRWTNGSIPKEYNHNAAFTMEWIDIAFCQINSDLVLVANNPTSRFPNGGIPKGDAFQEGSGFYTLKRSETGLDGTSDVWQISDITEHMYGKNGKQNVNKGQWISEMDQALKLADWTHSRTVRDQVRCRSILKVPDLLSAR